jgi:hypothetical protein
VGFNSIVKFAGNNRMMKHDNNNYGKQTDYVANFEYEDGSLSNILTGVACISVKNRNVNFI